MRPFLDSWIEETGRSISAPRSFLELSGLALASAYIGRSIHLKPYGTPQALFPNIWVALIAPSGFRKSTCIDMINCILNQVRFDSTVKNPLTKDVITEGIDRRIPEDVSPSALDEVLEEQPEGIMLYYELRELIGSHTVDWQRGLISKLLKIYDTPLDLPRARTKKIASKSGGRSNVDRPFISMIGGIPEDVIFRKSSADDLLGGFWPRFIPAVMTENAFPPADPLAPPMTPEFIEGVSRYFRQDVLPFCSDIRLNPRDHSVYPSTDRGLYDIPDAIRMFVYEKVEKDWKVRFKGKHMSAFLQRCGPNLYKLSLLYAFLNRGFNCKLEITQDDVNRSSNLLEECLCGAYNTFDCCLSEDRDEKRIESVLRAIRQVGKGEWVRRDELIGHRKMSLYRWDEAIEYGVQAKFIEERKERNGHGPPSKFYRSTERGYARVEKLPLTAAPADPFGLPDRGGAGGGEGQPASEPDFGGEEVQDGEVGG